jgi:hypothetical protein
LHDLLIMATTPPKSTREFGTRRPSVPVVTQPGPPAKRSGHVGLFLMGTLAVGGGAYALVPRDNCEPSPNVAQPSLLQSNTECRPRGSSSSGSGGGRSSFYSGGSSSSQSPSGTSDSGSSHVTRGGFGSFAHAFGFSGG